MINDNFNFSYEKSETEQMQTSHGWDGDPAADVIGICSSAINDGSVHHDRDIYGL